MIHCESNCNDSFGVESEVYSSTVKLLVLLDVYALHQKCSNFFYVFDSESSNYVNI